MQHEFLKHTGSPQRHQDQSKNKSICSGPERKVPTLTPWNILPSTITKQDRITACQRNPGRKHKLLLFIVVESYELQGILDNKMSVVPLKLDFQPVFISSHSPPSQHLVSAGYIQISVLRDHKKPIWQPKTK